MNQGVSRAVILAIDCGNTRVKWGLRYQGDTEWQALGAVPLADIALLEQAWSSLPAAARIVIANVAGAAVQGALKALLQRFPVEPTWVRAQAQQCGVRNAYAEPAQLGADRWAALIGARHLHGGACLVVNAGTATTADMLSADGEFRGGVIIPGLDVMKRALAMNTAGLPLAEGRYVDAPRCTADAIETGCLHAQAGAIERMAALLEPGALCLLSGGAAQRIRPLLNMPVRPVDNLALEGLARIGA
jgi:type III pantothenate kinase